MHTPWAAQFHRHSKCSAAAKVSRVRTRDPLRDASCSKASKRLIGWRETIGWQETDRLGMRLRHAAAKYFLTNYIFEWSSSKIIHILSFIKSLSISCPVLDRLWREFLYVNEVGMLRSYGCGLFLAPLMTTCHSLEVCILWCLWAFSIVVCIESTSM